MKLNLLLLAAIVAESAVIALTIPSTNAVQYQEPRHVDSGSQHEDLWKRKGGGGGGGHGGGDAGGGSSSHGSSGSSDDGGDDGGSSPGGSSEGAGSSASSTGGRTTTGSGPAPAYGGGSYYAGGSNVPYRAGTISPYGITPVFIASGSLVFWSTLWLHGAYFYPYTSPYTFYNATVGQNETKPVICACDATEECSCDDPPDSTVLDEIIGNGSYAALNQTLVIVADYNDASTILINGTLPNGTTASGGTDSPNAAGGLGTLLRSMGWWPVVGTICCMVFLS